MGEEALEHGLSVISRHIRHRLIIEIAGIEVGYLVVDHMMKRLSTVFHFCQLSILRGSVDIQLFRVDVHNHIGSCEGDLLRLEGHLTSLSRLASLKIISYCKDEDQLAMLINKRSTSMDA